MQSVVNIWWAVNFFAKLEPIVAKKLLKAFTISLPSFNILLPILSSEGASVCLALVKTVVINFQVLLRFPLTDSNLS